MKAYISEGRFLYNSDGNPTVLDYPGRSSLIEGLLQTQKALELELAKKLCSSPDIRPMIAQMNDTELKRVLKTLTALPDGDIESNIKNLRAITSGSKPMSLLDHFKSLVPEDNTSMVGSDEDDRYYEEFEPEPKIDYLSIITRIQELTATTDPSDIFPDVLKSFRDCSKQLEEKKSQGSAFIHVISAKEPPTELLLVMDKQFLDADLLNVIQYRLNRNKQALCMNFTVYAEAASLGLELPSVKHLGLLHHSGEGIASAFVSVIPKLINIGHSLPNCTRFTERGCGMQDDSGIDKVIKKIPGMTPPAVLKPKKLRENTLNASSIGGEEAANEMIIRMKDALIDGGVGRKCGTPLSIKFYVKGYNGDPKGAKPEEGLYAKVKIEEEGITKEIYKLDTRWLKYPKAIRFYDSRPARAGGSGGAAGYPEARAGGGSGAACYSEASETDPRTCTP